MATLDLSEGSLNGLLQLLSVLGGAVIKAIEAPAEERAKVLADEIATHSGALSALADFQAQSRSDIDAQRDENAKLRAEHETENAKLRAERDALQAAHAELQQKHEALVAKVVEAAAQA